MFEKLEITRMAQALSSYAGARLGLVAQNVANADTPGYKARDLPDFSEVWAGGRGLRATRPGHLGSVPGARADGADGTALDPVPRRRAADASPDGNTVALETEMLTAAALRQQNDMALAVYRTTSSVIRSSLGIQR